MHYTASAWYIYIASILLLQSKAFQHATMSMLSQSPLTKPISHSTRVTSSSLLSLPAPQGSLETRHSISELLVLW